MLQICPRVRGVKPACARVDNVGVEFFGSRVEFLQGGILDKVVSVDEVNVFAARKSEALISRRVAGVARIFFILARVSRPPNFGAYRSTMAELESVEQSSTTITSKSWNVWARRLSKHSPTYFSALYMGIITDTAVQD